MWDVEKTRIGRSDLEKGKEKNLVEVVENILKELERLRNDVARLEKMLKDDTD
jgi:hypothetical protein